MEPASEVVGGVVEEGGRASGPLPTPPTNRGVRHVQTLIPSVLEGVRFSRSIDWLSLVVGPEQDARILALSECGGVVDRFPKPPPRWKGFRCGEMREWIGGLVERYTSPAIESKEHGREYALWVFRGRQAHLAAPSVRGLGRPTRVDVAFDFEVPAEWGAVEFADASVALRPACYRKFRMNGCDLDRTVYVGGRDAPRMVRIYRKDLERGARWQFGPVLRIEVELKGEPAGCMWRAFQDGDERGFAMAAGELQKSLGVQVQDEREFWEVRLPAIGGDVIAKVAHLMRQYSSVLCALEAAGVRVAILADQCRHARSRGRVRAAFDERMLATLVCDLKVSGFYRAVVRECAAEVRRA